MKIIISIFKIIAGILLVAIILFVSPSIIDLLKNQVTVYPVTIDNSGHKLPLNRSVYKVFIKEQLVITWMPGILEVPIKLNNCTVRDRYHWQCKDSERILIMDGNHLEDSSEKDVNYVNRIEWLLSK